MFRDSQRGGRDGEHEDFRPTYVFCDAHANDQVATLLDRCGELRSLRVRNCRKLTNATFGALVRRQVAYLPPLAESLLL